MIIFTKTAKVETAKTTTTKTTAKPKAKSKAKPVAKTESAPLTDRAIDEILQTALPPSITTDRELNINIQKLFGFESINLDTEFKMELGTYTTVPDIDNNYVFNPDITNQIITYLRYPLHDCLWLFGHAGTGKTTAVLQVAARLGWGVQQITASNKMESLDLIGHTTLINGSLVYEYGALSYALKYGEILLVNEIDTMSPSDLSALNDVLEGKPLTIPQNNNELIKPHKNFRMIVTANTCGMGDNTGLYGGTRPMNQAFLDRFRFVEVDYPTKEYKAEIIERAYHMAKTEVDKLLKFDEDLLRALQTGLENGIQQISSPFTVRSLLKIAGLVHTAHMDIRTAVAVGYSNRLPEQEREFVTRLVNDVWGHPPVDKSIGTATDNTDDSDLVA